MQRDNVLKILAEHRDELRQQFGVKSLALFGSVARGEATETSDVDLLIEFERPVGLFHFLTVQHYLEDLLGVAQVDLVMPDALHKELKEGFFRKPFNAPKEREVGLRPISYSIGQDPVFYASQASGAFSANDLVVDAVLRKFLDI